MRKQVLSVEQMQHLQELGLEMKETMLYWCHIQDSRPRAATNNGKWTLCKGKNNPCVAIQHWEYIPAYTLQDVLDKLPEEIKYKRKDYHLELWLREGEWSIGYLHFDIDDVLYAHHEQDKEILNAAYEMLCWCIKEGYVQTN